jgi:fibro-slime domain-containing protein
LPTPSAGFAGLLSVALVAIGATTAGCSFSHDAFKEGDNPVAGDGGLTTPDAGFTTPDRIYIGDLIAGDSQAGMPPPGVVITPSDIGGYGLGPALSGSGTTGGDSVPGSAGCNAIVGIARDFKGRDEPSGHPDFQAFIGQQVTKGLVANQLGPTNKPVYASRCEGGTMNATACPFGQMTTSQANFDEWYRSTDGVNLPYLIYFQFAPNAGVTTFSSTSFFPLDGTGWGDSGADGMGVQHNFGFTTELHTTFRYGGGEHFTFVGDDVVWVFINGQLAVDLGGVHSPVTGTVDLDAMAATLGITPGNNYPMELFQAERHTSQSNFRIDTNLVFVDCGIVIF